MPATFAEGRGSSERQGQEAKAPSLHGGMPTVCFKPIRRDDANQHGAAGDEDCGEDQDEVALLCGCQTAAAQGQLLATSCFYNHVSLSLMGWRGVEQRGGVLWRGLVVGCAAGSNNCRGCAPRQPVNSFF